MVGTLVAVGEGRAVGVGDGRGVSVGAGVSVGRVVGEAATVGASGVGSGAAALWQAVKLKNKLVSKSRRNMPPILPVFLAGPHF